MMSESGTPTVLKKILDRKREEVAERSATVSIAALQEQIKTASAPRGFVRSIEAKLATGLSLIHI